MHPLLKKALSLLSLVLMILGFQFIWFKDWGLTAIVVGSIVLHEVGHASWLRLYGIGTSMFFVPFLGAAVVSDRQARERLSDLQNSFVVLAGPWVNTCLALLGGLLLLMPTGVEEKYWLALLAINLNLAYFNLLPFGIFDGGKFVKELFDSSNEAKDKRIVIITAVVAALSAVVLILLGNTPFLYLLIMFGIRKKSKEDDPKDAYMPTKMSRRTANVLFVLYLIILFGAMIAAAIVPDWIALFGIWPAS